MFDFVRQRIYLKLVLTLMLGIGAGYLWPLPARLLIGEIVVLVILLIALALIWRLISDERHPYGLLIGCLLLVITGYVNTSLAINLPLSAPLRQHADSGEVQLTGKIITTPKYQRGHLRFMFKVDEAEGVEGEPVATVGLCYVFLKADAPPELYLFDRIKLRCELNEAGAAANRGAFDYRGYLLLKGTTLTAYAENSRAVTMLKGPSQPWKALTQLRGHVTSNLAERLPAELGGLAVSVVYGDKITDLPEDLKERFRRAGLTHILVASGTQVSLLIVLLALLFIRFVDDFTWRGVLYRVGQFALTISVVLVYATITGFETSIIRALVMGVLVLLGRLVYREADGLSALSQAALVVLLVNPLKLFEAGFLLSFGATFGLIYVAGIGFPLIAHWRGPRRWLGKAFLTTAGAQLFVAPLLILFFNQLSLWGLFSNLIAIPLAFALLIAGGLGSLGLLVIPGLGWLLGWAIHILSWLLNATASLFASLPGNDLAIPTLPWWVVLACYALIFLAGEWVKARRELTPRLQLALTYSVGGLLLLLLACVLSWKLLPRPGLSMLSLPGCEGYLWRSVAGENVLLLHSPGLERRHNDDTVLSSLRSRGISRPVGVVWLDMQPAEQLFLNRTPDEFSLGETLPVEWDVAWLGDAGSPWGMVLGLRGERLWLVFSKPTGEALLAGRADGPAAVMLQATTWSELGKELRHGLCSLSQDVWVADPYLRLDGWPGMNIARTEIDVVPAWGGLSFRLFEPVSERFED